jgi:DNA repair exonuclease SbcCD ATPase subunit
LISFGKIRWKNLLSTGNAFTEVDLGFSGTTLIVGANGEGKSTLLDALSFALYGKPFRKVNKGQLVNSINKRDLLVECEFTVGDSQFMVRRGMKPNVFEVWVDGDRLNQESSLAEQQEHLERYVLKMNHRACMQVVILGSASFVQFMELPASHRREVLEDILDVRVVGVMQERLKHQWSETVARVKDLQTKSAILADRLTMRERFNAAQKQSAEDRVAYHRAKIAELEEATKSLAEKGISLTSLLEDLESRFDATVDKRHDVAMTRYYQVEAELKALLARKSYFSSTDKCASCEQDITHEHVSRMSETLSSKIEELSSKVSSARAEEHKLAKLSADNRAVASEVLRIRSEIASIKREIQANARAIKTETDAASMVTEVSQPDSEDESHLRTEIEETNIALSSALGMQQAMSLVSGALKDDGAKSVILDKYVPKINELINKYLAELDFYVQFELDSEFNETIKSRHRDEFSYHSFSEGEKMRIDLAILFAWRAVARARNSASTNVVIMDEIFDSSLDPSGAEELMKLITRLTGDVGVVIISHRGDQIADKFDRVLRFEKHRNFSRMV